MMADAAEDQLSYFIKDEQAFGKIVCSAKTLDENLLEGNPCEFEVVPKGNQTYFLVVMVGMISFFSLCSFQLLLNLSQPLPNVTNMTNAISHVVNLSSFFSSISSFLNMQ